MAHPTHLDNMPLLNDRINPSSHTLRLLVPDSQETTYDTQASRYHDTRPLSNSNIYIGPTRPIVLPTFHETAVRTFILGIQPASVIHKQHQGCLNIDVDRARARGPRVHRRNTFATGNRENRSSQSGGSAGRACTVALRAWRSLCAVAMSMQEGCQI